MAKHCRLVVAILAAACLPWAVARAQPAQPLDRGEYQALAAIDMGANNEYWPNIRELVRDFLSEAGLRVLDVSPPQPKATRGRAAAKEEEKKRESRLIRALRDAPCLIVLGSCREYTDEEVAAISAYVRSGGALLALPRGTNRSNMRIVWLNAVLLDFGIVVSLGRTAASAKAYPHPITEGLSDMGRIPGGISIWGYAGRDLVHVGRLSVARVVRVELGRVAVVDPLPWLFEQRPPRAGKKFKPRSDRWQTLMVRVVAWLCEGMKIRRPGGHPAGEQQ